MTTPYPTAEGCRWCGTARRDHAQHWHPLAGWHGWVEPTRQQIHERMRARLAKAFERRWRAAANADPRHATYPEAVPGYRASRAAAARTRPAEGPRTHPADLDAHRGSQPVEPITRTDHDTGGMIVQWPALDARPAEPLPAVDAPVTVAEIRAEIEREAAAEAELLADLAGLARLATDNAVQALTAAIARHETRRARRWWDPRRWWTR